MTKHCRFNDDNITFFERDSSGVEQPHDDPLVLVLAIEGFNIRTVLVNNGSSADIMYMTAYQHMKLDPK